MRTPAIGQHDGSPAMVCAGCADATAVSASRPAVSANPRQAIPRQMTQAATMSLAAGLRSKGS